MSTFGEKLTNVEGSAAVLVNSLTYVPLNAQDIKELLKTVDFLTKAKEEIEHALRVRYTDLTSEIADIKFEKPSLVDAKPRKMPSHLKAYNPATDQLLNDITVCGMLKIRTPTLSSWRKNWTKTEGIGFPPPVIYVYGSPRWTHRLVEWWINDSGEKAFIKGSEDERNTSTSRERT